MESGGHPAKRGPHNESLSEAEFYAIIAEIEQTSDADTSITAAPTAVAARQPSSSLYEEMLRYQEEHTEEAQSLLSGLQDNLPDGQLVRHTSVNSDDDAKPAAFPQGVFRQPISRNYFTRKSLIDSSSHSDIVSSSPPSITSALHGPGTKQSDVDDSSIKGTMDEFVLQTQLVTQSTEEIIEMILENESNESNKQQSDRENDEAIARQLQEDFNRSWTPSSRFSKKQVSGEVGLFRQLSLASDLVEWEENADEPLREPDDSLHSRRHSCNPVANGGLSPDVDVEWQRNFLEAFQTRTDCEALTPNVESFSESQQPQGHHLPRQNHVLHRGNGLFDRIPSEESMMHTRSYQGARLAYDADKPNSSLEALSSKNDASPGKNVRETNIDTRGNNLSAIEQQRLNHMRFSDIRNSDQNKLGVTPRESQEGNNNSYNPARHTQSSYNDLSSGFTAEGIEATATEWGHNESLCFGERNDKVSEALLTKDSDSIAVKNLARDANVDPEGTTQQFMGTTARPFRPRAARTVRCHGCYQKLQARINYQLVHCPVCRVISPCRK